MLIYKMSYEYIIKRVKEFDIDVLGIISTLMPEHIGIVWYQIKHALNSV